MRKLNGVRPFGMQCFSLEKKGEEVVISFVHEEVRHKRPLEVGSLDSEDFTSDLEVIEQELTSSDTSIVPRKKS